MGATVRVWALVLLTTLAPRQASAGGLFDFLSDLFSGVGRIVAAAGESEGKVAGRISVASARTPPASSLHYLSGRRLLRDDWAMAHGGPLVETVERAVAKGELESIRANGVLMRRGRVPLDSKIYVTNRVPASATVAQRRLALPRKPDYSVRLVVPKRVFSPPTRVKPMPRLFRPTLPGGGIERTAPGPRIIPVKVVKQQRLTP